MWKDRVVKYTVFFALFVVFIDGSIRIIATRVYNCENSVLISTVFPSREKTHSIQGYHEPRKVINTYKKQLYTHKKHCIWRFIMFLQR